jgi:hypothetical protein
LQPIHFSVEDSEREVIVLAREYGILDGTADGIAISCIGEQSVSADAEALALLHEVV